MSIVGTAQERPDSPTYEGDLNRRTYTRKFRVQSDSLNDGPLAVCKASGIPFLYSAYVFGGDFDGYALAREITAERYQPASLYWIVTVRYETPTPENGNLPAGSEREQAGAFDNPLLMLPEISITTEKFQEVIYAVFSADGIDIAEDGVVTSTLALTPCKASNGQVFDPPPVRDRSRLVLTITRNEPLTDIHPTLSLLWQDTVNADRWWGAKPGQVKCQSITSERQTKQISDGSTFAYLKVVYRFEARDTWVLRLLDAGTWYRDGSGNQHKFHVDGHPTTGALDGNGKKLADGALPVWQYYTIYPKKKFGLLNLPQSFIQVA